MVEIDQKKYRSIITGAAIGTTMEWYDFFIAGLAASVVWPIVFFPKVNPALALAASLSSYVVTYFMRPIGAYIFGHFGDRLGRKSMLIWTLTLMGIASFGVALVPSFSAIGYGGVALIIVFRIILGIGLGGEWGGASALTTEYTVKSKRKGYLSGWINVSLGAGVALAAGLFTISRLISPSTFISFGWRIPFLVGGVLIIIGVAIRYRLTESPLFEMQKQKKKLLKSPAMEALKDHAGIIVFRSLIFVYVIAVFSGVILAFSIPYLVVVHHFNPTFVYETIIVAALTTMLTTELGAMATDRWGNKIPLMISILGTIVLIYPYYLMVSTLNPALIMIAQAMIAGVNFIGFGVLVRLYTGTFATKYRYSAGGLTYQLGAALGSVTAIINPVLGAQKGGVGALYMVVIVIICSVISLIPVLYLKGRGIEESFDTEGAAIEKDDEEVKPGPA